MDADRNMKGWRSPTAADLDRIEKAVTAAVKKEIREQVLVDPFGNDFDMDAIQKVIAQAIKEVVQ